MERDHNIATDTIELGIASVETRGPIGPLTDQRQGFAVAGLNDD